jgi:2-keto-4-pentenoate hydratase/2-oxohepta-3-ene-1,7-dioic acid hydratase in catechol pathway
VVELHAANAALERTGRYATVPMPEDMLGLIERYEYGLKPRLYELVDHLVAQGLLEEDRPAWIHDVGAVRTLPPILYPGKILNAAVNFYSHVEEAGTEAERLEARRQRRENRGVPYLFLKPSRGAVIGDGDPVVIPWGRDRTDWFVGKGHDSFAPQGPWIVPKEFYGNPMEILRQTLSVGDEQMQEATAGDMIHSLWELIEYASSIITLYPGDVINNGTSGGVGMGTAVRGAQRYLQPGEVITATIDGIGTLRLPVVAEEEPEGLTGAQLPPVKSYRD